MIFILNLIIPISDQYIKIISYLTNLIKTMLVNSAITCLNKYLKTSYY